MPTIKHFTSNEAPLIEKVIITYTPKVDTVDPRFRKGSIAETVFYNYYNNKDKYDVVMATSRQNRYDREDFYLSKPTQKISIDVKAPKTIRGGIDTYAHGVYELINDYGYEGIGYKEHNNQHYYAEMTDGGFNIIDSNKIKALILKNIERVNDNVGDYRTQSGNYCKAITEPLRGGFKYQTHNVIEYHGVDGAIIDDDDEPENIDYRIFFRGNAQLITIPYRDIDDITVFQKIPQEYFDQAEIAIDAVFNEWLDVDEDSVNKHQKYAIMHTGRQFDGTTYNNTEYKA